MALGIDYLVSEGNTGKPFKSRILKQTLPKVLKKI